MLNKYGIRRTEKEALKCVKRETADRMLKSHAKKRGGMEEIRQLLSRRESASTAHGVLFGGGGREKKKAQKCVHLSALAARTTRDRDTSQPRK